MHVHQPSKGRSKLLTLHQTFARLLVAERQSRSLPASTSHNNVKSKCSGKNSDLKRMISSRRPPPWPPRGRAPPAPPQIAPSAHRRCKKKTAPYSVKQHLKKLYMTIKQQREEDYFDSTRAYESSSSNSSLGSPNSASKDWIYNKKKGGIEC
jgi:hypothetical protein